MRRLQILVVLLAGLTCACGAPAAADYDGQTGRDGFDGSPPLGNVDPCMQLVTSVCGVGLDAGWCEQSATCEAVQLTAQYEPDRCEEKLSQSDRYPACEDTEPPRQDSACTDLVTKTCGSADVAGGACRADETCLNALDVADGGYAPVCHQALGDGTSFPRCQR